MKAKIEKPRFSPVICVTHDCNLNCSYCYQKHDSNNSMTLDIAKNIIDAIFDNMPVDTSGVEIGIIGGEPLLEFNLLKEIVAYTCSKKREEKYIFYATTNGTMLSEEMKTWFTAHKNIFVLGISLDGTRETHNYNRCNSFDKIDIDFFLRTWSNQSVKMTLSEYSLSHLAKDIKFLHSKGIKDISGVNLSEGDFDWSDDKYIKLLVPQLKELVEFYTNNDSLYLNQMFRKQLHLCEAKEKERYKWCGIGTNCPFFDVDGRRYPCAFITPMTFTSNELVDILKTDFTNNDNFLDVDCFENCYIYPICPTCAGANYLVNKTFKKRNKCRCRIQKLTSLFIADLQAKRIEKKPKIYDDYTLYHTIEAIKKIRSLYLSEFEEYLS